MKNILLINAHQRYPGIAEGKLNATLMEVIKGEMEARGCEVRQTVIEQGYVVDEEVRKHVWADVIIAQAPVYWFGMPWIHKKYVDEVFSAGLVQQSMAVSDGRTRQEPGQQYGTGGKMQGKRYMVSLTWNAPREAFGDEGQYLLQGKTVDDVFLGNTAVYRFCGAEILPSFSCYDVVKAGDVAGDIARLKAHLARVL